MKDYLALFSARSITTKHNSFKLATEASEILTVWHLKIVARSDTYDM